MIAIHREDFLLPCEQRYPTNSRCDVNHRSRQMFGCKKTRLSHIRTFSISTSRTQRYKRERRKLSQVSVTKDHGGEDIGGLCCACCYEACPRITARRISDEMNKPILSFIMKNVCTPCFVNMVLMGDFFSLKLSRRQQLTLRTLHRVLQARAVLAALASPRCWGNMVCSVCLPDFPEAMTRCFASYPKPS